MRTDRPGIISEHDLSVFIIFFGGIEIVLSAVSLFLIFKDKQVGYILLAISILSTYIITFEHRMLW